MAHELVITPPSPDDPDEAGVEVRGKMSWQADAEAYEQAPDEGGSCSCPCPIRCAYCIVHFALVTPPALLSTCAWLPFGCARLTYARACCCINNDGDLATEAMLPLSAQRSPAVRCFFDGAGWAVGFELGVGAWIQRQKHWDVSNWSVFAISAGCIPGLMLVLGMDINEFANVHFSAFRSAMLGSCTFGFCSDLTVVRDFFDMILPEDAYLQATGKFTAVVAKWPTTGFAFLSTFDSNEELIDAMLCSMNLLPGFAWLPRPYCYEGRRGCYIDGGHQSAVVALDAVMDIPVRVFKRPCRETSIAPGDNTGTVLPIPHAFFPPSKLKLRSTMKKAALDAEAHRDRIDAVLTAHARKQNTRSGGGGGISRTRETRPSLESDPLIVDSEREAATADAVFVLPSADKVSIV